MTPHEDNDILAIILKAAGLGVLWVLSKLIANYHDIMGNVFITVSLAFVVYKFRIEYLKNNRK